MMDIKKLKRQLSTEVDASFLYDSMSKIQNDPDLSQVLQGLAQIEQKHATRMLEKIRQWQPNAKMPSPSLQARLHLKMARLFGYRSIINALSNIEKQVAVNAIHSKKLKGQPMTGAEHNHLKIIQALNNNTAIHVSAGLLSKFESRHNSVGGNALRAAVLGANDGLVSNMSLVMGIAGAAAQNSTILLTGIAGLLAGAISMALGEWLSVQSARELHQRQIELEMEELETSPEEEKNELILLYQAKGMHLEAAKTLAEEKFQHQDTALDALIVEELGIDKDDLGGSAWEAAIASFSLFSIGAIIPVLPYFFLTGKTALYGSLTSSVVGLFLIGAAITLFTGKSAIYSGTRQIVFGLSAAAVTYFIGHLIGISLAS